MIAPNATAPVVSVPSAHAHPDRGLEGDRYFDAHGTFAAGRPGSALTLVDAQVPEELADAHGGTPIDHRRNVVVRGTDLNARSRLNARRRPLPRPPAVRTQRPPRPPQRRAVDPQAWCTAAGCARTSSARGQSGWATR